VWIHRLGNLTLLSRPFNSSIGNKTWKEKKRIYLNKKKSKKKAESDDEDEEGIATGFSITIDVANKFDEWTPKECQSRHDLLLKELVNIWHLKDKE